MQCTTANKKSSQDLNPECDFRVQDVNNQTMLSNGYLLMFMSSSPNNTEQDGPAIVQREKDPDVRD